MAQYLRVVRQARWFVFPDIDWLPKNTVQADALLDLKPKDNRLSLWLIGENGENLERVASAIATTRTDLVVLDYALLDSDHIDQIGLKERKSSGTTLDEEANAECHRDFVELTIPHVCELAEVIRGHSNVVRVPWKTLGEWLKEGITAGRIDSSRLNPKITTKLGKLE